VGESRAYRLKEDEPLPEAVARAARGRIDHAIDELRGRTDSTPVEAVHEARKDMKKLRALLRLARGELGRQTYSRENACFRDAARELAGQRDADVMLETLERLTYLPAGDAWEVRKRIQADRERNGGDGDRSAAARSAAAILKEARGRVRNWPLERDSFDALAKGLEKTYRRGRREFEAALDEPTVASLHEWRKRVKHLWYHHTLLRSLWPPVMEVMGDDLAMLAEWVEQHGGAGPRFREAVDRRRGELQAEAFALGARVYAEKPRAYVKRLKGLWAAREHRVRAP
jgi:CHAD domain